MANTQRDSSEIHISMQRGKWKLNFNMQVYIHYSTAQTGANLNSNLNFEVVKQRRRSSVVAGFMRGLMVHPLVLRCAMDMRHASVRSQLCLNWIRVADVAVARTGEQSLGVRRRGGQPKLRSSSRHLRLFGHLFHRSRPNPVRGVVGECQCRWTWI